MAISVSNPFQAPLLLQTAAVLGAVLGAALPIVALLERKQIRQFWHGILFQRWFTWLLLGPIYMLAIFGGELTALLLVSGFVFQGLREYATLVRLPRLYRHVLLALGLALMPVALMSREAFLALPPLLLILGTLQPVLTQDIQAGTRHLAFAALGFGYLPWLLGHFLLLDKWSHYGPAVLLVLGPAVALSDVGAFTIGRLFGQRKLAPIISPNKTLAGLIGSVLGAYLGLGLMQFVLPPDHRLLLLATLPPLVALGAVWGDLLESLMKREFDVKDTGTWLPGMGGLLDRIDSLIIVLPLVYYYLLLIS